MKQLLIIIITLNILFAYEFNLENKEFNVISVNYKNKNKFEKYSENTNDIDIKKNDKIIFIDSTTDCSNKTDFYFENYYNNIDNNLKRYLKMFNKIDSRNKEIINRTIKVETNENIHLIISAYKPTLWNIIDNKNKIKSIIYTDNYFQIFKDTKNYKIKYIDNKNKFSSYDFFHYFDLKSYLNLQKFSNLHFKKDVNLLNFSERNELCENVIKNTSNYDTVFNHLKKDKQTKFYDSSYKEVRTFINKSIKDGLIKRMDVDTYHKWRLKHTNKYLGKNIKVNKNYRRYYPSSEGSLYEVISDDFINPGFGGGLRTSFYYGSDIQKINGKIGHGILLLEDGECIRPTTSIGNNYCLKKEEYIKKHN